MTNNQEYNIIEDARKEGIAQHVDLLTGSTEARRAGNNSSSARTLHTKRNIHTKREKHVHTTATHSTVVSQH